MARNRQQGFTLVELMIAMTVLMLATVGAASMQIAVTRANVDARNRTVATDYLRTWLERVKMDSMAWTGAGVATPNLFTGSADGEWFIPDPALLGANAATSSDFYGWDNAAVASARYCVHLRQTDVVKSVDANPLDSGRALRVDVRVWWHREGGSSPWGVADGSPIDSNRNLVAGCGTIITAPVNDVRIHTLIGSTVVKWSGI